VKEQAMIDLNDYFYFVQVVEKQGFSAAAEKLNMPKSRLSRHVRQLEERLNARLIQRTSRQFHVTEAGNLFYRHARSLIDEMELTESVMKQQQVGLSGRISLSCSVGVAQYALKDLLIQFIGKHPNIELAQHVSNHAIDLVSAGIDLAVRGHVEELADSSLIQRHLANVPWYLFASPDFIEEFGKPQSPYDLFKQKALKVGWQKGQGHWSLENASGLKTTVPFEPILSSDDMGTLKQAAIAGMGVVALPAYTCRDELYSGVLIKILPEWTVGNAQLTLLFPSRQGVPAQVQALRDYLLSEVAKHLSP
jgi:DNA-binding transcriptional LysR family regulator